MFAKEREQLAANRGDILNNKYLQLPQVAAMTTVLSNVKAKRMNEVRNGWQRQEKEKKREAFSQVALGRIHFFYPVAGGNLFWAQKAAIFRNQGF